jgi:hypothetical protein
MHMWHHVTNHLIISNDKDSNSENRIKLRVRDTILKVYDPNLETRVEVDASGYATGGILSQQYPDGLWHPIAYQSSSMSKEEHNYEIYNREMLGCMRALEDWRCHGCVVFIRFSELESLSLDMIRWLVT